MDRKGGYMKIISIGHYVPEKRISNYEIANKIGYDMKFVKNKIGFTKLSRKNDDESLTDMCLKAFDCLKQKQKINIKEIQLIIVVTQNPYYRVPHSSALIHNALNVGKECMTFDVSQGCAGYLHALLIAKGLFDSLDISKALLFTCDCYSEIIDNTDKDVCMLFGDAATVSFLSKCGKGYSVKDAVFGTMPRSNKCIYCIDKLKMNGGQVFDFVTSVIPDSIMKLLKCNDLKKDDIDLYVLHPGSKYIVKSLNKILKLNENKVEFSATDYGNTVSSSIPLQLERYCDNDFKELMLLSGYGVGFSWADCLLEYNEE